MINRHHILIALAVFLFSCNRTFAQSSNSYEFLNIPVSAHSSALGGQNITIQDDDITMVFTNPALLSNVSHNTLNFDYTSYIASTSKVSAAFARHAGEHSNWAVAAQYLSYGSIDETDEMGHQMGQFTPSDLSIQGTYSYLFTEYWSGAVTGKLLYSKYGMYNAFALGVDLGVNYRNEDLGLSISAVGRNFGRQLDPLYEQRENLPFDFALGFSKNLGHAPIRISITLDDLTHWHNINFIQHCIVGADVFIGSVAWVGLGYNFRQAKEMKTLEGKSHMAGFNVGAGLNVKKLKLGVAWGKHHMSSSSLIANASFAF